MSLLSWLKSVYPHNTHIDDFIDTKLCDDIWREFQLKYKKSKDEYPTYIIYIELLESIVTDGGLFSKP